MKKARLKINYNSYNYKSIIYTKGTILTYINDRYQINANDTFGLVTEYVESNPDIFEIIEEVKQTCSTCIRPNCGNRNGSQLYLPCWTNKEESKKNIVEVKIPEDKELKEIIKGGNHVDGTICTMLYWKDKQPTKSCKTCLFELYSKMEIEQKQCTSCNLNRIYTNNKLDNWQSKQDLSNTKIWIGDNPKLKDILQTLLKKWNYVFINNELCINVTNIWFINIWFINKSTYRLGTDTKDQFNQLSCIEITPQDLGITKEEYEIKLVTEDGVKLYVGDKPYCYNPRTESLWEFEIKPLTQLNKGNKLFSTKKVAEEWIKNNSKLYLGDVEVEIIKSRVINTSNFSISSTSSLLQNCYSYKVYTDKGQVYTTDWLKWYDKLIKAKETEGVVAINLQLANFVTMFSLYEVNNNNSIGCISDITWEQVEKITNKIKEIIR